MAEALSHDYIRRVVDDELDELIDAGASAISLDGAKAVGKTATGTARTNSVLLLEDERTREFVMANPDALLKADSVLIDEWQRVASTWDAVRRAVDRGARPGQFVLTGSASGKNSGTHSGAGRILKVRMRPMTLPERGVEQPSVSMRSLLMGDHPVVEGETKVGLDQYTDEICRSGFPGIRTLGERLRRAQLVGYTSRVVDRDIDDLTGRTIRNPAALRRWMTAYAAATSTNTTYDRLRDAATPGDGDKPAKTTTMAYRDALESLYILDPLSAWAPSAGQLAELAVAPKHHLVDPALAVSLLGLNPASLLSGAGPSLDRGFLGALFESLMTLSVRVFAQGAEATVGHLRTHRGEHEVDLIVERADARIVAVEVKMSATIDDTDVRHLRWLRERMGDHLLDAVIVTTGRHAYRRTDGIAVVPAALLGP